MLSCRDLATRLASDYVDGELGPVDGLRVRLHLAACENCRRFIEQFRRVRELLRRGADPAVPAVDADAQTASGESLRELAARLRAVAGDENNSS